MKRANINILFLIIFLFFTFYPVAAQPVPPFKMLLTNGKIFTQKDLPNQKPLVIIYFSPDCEHCQTLMNAFFKKVNNFKSVEIVMVTFRPLIEVAGFEKLYHTNKYPNIIVGTEVPVFFFKMYFNLSNTPFTVLYDKQGLYNYSYRKETPIDDLINRVKLLVKPANFSKTK